MESCHINKNQINLELIEIIQFCLKICDLLKHPHLFGGCIGGWVDGWVNMWVNGGSFLDIGRVVDKACIYTMKGR